MAFTHALWGARAVEALVWVSASSRDAIVTGFAQAASTVGAADQALCAEAAAVRFISWLAHTRRPWALILDDLASLDDLADLWPAGPAGQVVITTRLPETVFQAGPRIAPVGGFSRREVLAYLGARLTDFPDQRADALDLGADLDGLPLALAQAAAVMTVNRLSCREYRGRLGERREHMSAIRVDGVSPAVLATWSLAVECAHDLPPAGRGLAGPRAGRHAGSERDTRRRADQPGRVRLRGRPAERRGSGGPDPGPGGHHQPGPGRPDQHRSGQPGPDRADAPERAGRGAGLPAARGLRAGRARRGRGAAAGLAGRRPGARPAPAAQLDQAQLEQAQRAGPA